MIDPQEQERAQRRREDSYALRRTLVQQLQAAARGVTRRERVELHRRFAEDWRAFTVAERPAPELIISRLPSQWDPRVERPGKAARDQAELFELDRIA